jgi:molecular chaperone HtpG
MTAEEIKKYINQIAFSGAEEFVEKFKEAKDANEIIGRFGLGFYSAFMVADKVEIQTLSYQEGAEPAHWECDGSTEFESAKAAWRSAVLKLPCISTRTAKNF